MSRKEWILVGAVLVLAGWWVVSFSGWFKPKVMRIEHSVRISPAVRPGARAPGNVTFALHQNYRLTSVKVVVAEEARTNQFAPALWHLASESGSEPVNGFSYGVTVKGMHPPPELPQPEPLKAGIEYRLLVEASGIKAEHDFMLPATGQGR